MYNTGVASIRGGLLKKIDKGWQNDVRSFFLPKFRRLTASTVVWTKIS